MFIVIVFLLRSDRPSGLFLCMLCVFSYSRLSYLLRLFLYLISFLLFPCANVWENTLEWVPNFYCHTEWYFLFFPTAQLHVHKRRSRRDSLIGWWFSNLLLLLIIIICLLILHFDQLVIGRRDCFILCPLYFFPYSRLSSYPLRSLCLISFLLSQFASMGKHSGMSSQFPIAILNGTSFLPFLVQEKLNMTNGPYYIVPEVAAVQII